MHVNGEAIHVRPVNRLRLGIALKEEPFGLLFFDRVVRIRRPTRGIVDPNDINFLGHDHSSRCI
jgi:hypothetical protein